jgi:hypothetical protein
MKNSTIAGLRPDLSHCFHRCGLRIIRYSN